MDLPGHRTLRVVCGIGGVPTAVRRLPGRTDIEQDRRSIRQYPHRRVVRSLDDDLLHLERTVWARCLRAHDHAAGAPVRKPAAVRELCDKEVPRTVREDSVAAPTRC